MIIGLGLAKKLTAEASQFGHHIASGIAKL